MQGSFKAVPDKVETNSYCSCLSCISTTLSDDRALEIPDIINFFFLRSRAHLRTALNHGAAFNRFQVENMVLLITTSGFVSFLREKTSRNFLGHP